MRIGGGRENQMVYIFSGCLPTFRNFFDKNLTLEQKTGSKDINEQMHFTDAAIKLNMASLGVNQMLLKENIKLGIPKENIKIISETKESFPIDKSVIIYSLFKVTTHLQIIYDKCINKRCFTFNTYKNVISQYGLV
jgi:hypothetical protein